MTCDTSIIVLSYNNYDRTTGPCLESLLAGGAGPESEIIVVDNRSTDGSAEKLSAVYDGHPRVRLVRNARNRGFAGGNNDGAACARGRFLLLLNSDTLVPDGAVAKLTALLRAHGDWAMLGPVTNQAGNEQKILTRGGDTRAILAEGADWCAHADDDAYPSDRLDFFCVAIRKTVYARLGGLDEQFGVGYFEDTDFSQQVKDQGLTMMFTEGVFIYHQAGKSFSSVGRGEVKRIMRENRKKLMEKHHGRVKLLHMRQCNAAVMAHYVTQRHAVPDDFKRLRFKFDNRMALAKTMMPNNPLKKWRYAIQLRQLNRGFYR